MGPEKAPESRTDLFVSQEIAAIQLGCTDFNRRGKAVFLLKEAKDDILDHLAGVEPLLGGPARQPVLQVGIEANLHGARVRRNREEFNAALLYQLSYELVSRPLPSR